MKVYLYILRFPIYVFTDKIVTIFLELLVFIGKAYSWNTYKKLQETKARRNKTLYSTEECVCAINSRNRAVISALKDVPFSISTSFAFYANQVGAREI